MLILLPSMAWNVRGVSRLAPGASARGAWLRHAAISGKGERLTLYAISLYIIFDFVYFLSVLFWREVGGETYTPDR